MEQVGRLPGLLDIGANPRIVGQGRRRDLDYAKHALVPRHRQFAESGRRRTVSFDEEIAARGWDEEEVFLVGFVGSSRSLRSCVTPLRLAVAVADRDVTRDSLLPGSVCTHNRQ